MPDMPLAEFLYISSSSELAVIVAVGLGAGVLGGLLGIGGGLVMIPAMLLLLGERFGPGSMHVYKLAALAAASVLSFQAARQHARAGAIVRGVLPAIIIGSVIGVLAGTVLAAQFAGEQTRILRRIFGAFMLLSVFSQVWRARLGKETQATVCPTPRRSGMWLGWVGIPSGVIGGLLGVGGGVWAVPVQQVGFGVQIRNAIANSSCMIVAVSLAACVTLSVSIARMPDLEVGAGWMLAAGLAPGALVGGWIGGGLTHRIDTTWLRGGFQVLLVVTGVRLLM